MVEIKNNRKKYWESYYPKYWTERVSKEMRNDCRPPNEKIFDFYLKKMKIKPSDKVLDIGCGFGRFFPTIAKHRCEIYGIDISSTMIKKAFSDYGAICRGLVVGEAEHLPFKDNLFDKIICWAVFDSLFQKKALIEINRTLKCGGLAMITGKNDNYCDDDKNALIAEINARKKRHPNYFTDLKCLLNNLHKFGFKLVLAFYFRRRGDMGSNKFTRKEPPMFYEYIIYLKKMAYPDIKSVCNIIISDKFSKTFKRIGVTRG